MNQIVLKHKIIFVWIQPFLKIFQIILVIIFVNMKRFDMTRWPRKPICLKGWYNDTFLQILRKIFKRQSRITLFDVSWFFHEQILQNECQISRRFYIWKLQIYRCIIMHKLFYFMCTLVYKWKSSLISTNGIGWLVVLWE